MFKTTFKPFFILLFIASLTISCQEPTHQTEPPYEGPPKGHIISVERAQQMYDAYSERRVPIIQKYEDSLNPAGEQFTPTRYAEFDLETVKQYIAYVEEMAKKAQVDVKTFRFYLSTYPAGDSYPNGDEVKFPRRNSIFVVPTMAYDGQNVGFSVEETDGVYTAVPIKRAPSPKSMDEENLPKDGGQVNEAGILNFSAAVPPSESSSLIMNDGHIVPPPGTNDFGEDN